jgi:hypothetical protein
VTTLSLRVPATSYDAKVAPNSGLNSFAHPEIISGGLIRSIDAIAPGLGVAAIFDPWAFRPQTQTFTWNKTIQVPGG